MNYKFPQFEIEIENPTITIVKKSQPDLDVDLINIQVLLSTVNSKKSHTLKDIYCPDVKTADFMQLALTALEEFKVEEVIND